MAVPKLSTSAWGSALRAGVLLLVFSGAGCSVDSAKRHYVLAEKLWTDGKYSAAVNEFEKVAARDPHGALGTQALLRGATTQALFLAEYPAAIQKFRRFTEISHDPAAVWDARKQIGDILFNKTEQYDQALRYYEDLIRMQPDAPEHGELMYRVARSQFFLGRFDDAITTYLKMIHEFPKTTLAERAAFEIAQTHLARGEQTGATHSAQDLLKTAMVSYQGFLKQYSQSPLVPEAEFGIASCLEALDQLDAAFQAYEALLDRYPSRKVIEIKLERIRERKAQRSH